MYEFNKIGEEQNYWISYTDLVTGFMIIFIIITLVLFNRQADEITIDAKYEELSSVFEESLKNNEEIFVTENAAVRFSAFKGRILFEQGDYYPTERFEQLLDQFIPIYFEEIETIYTDTVGEIEIKELRIEGHTDSEGDYLTNLRYSSGRAQKVQSYLLQSESFEGLDQELQDFIKKNSIAVGYSKSRLLDNEGSYTDQTNKPEDQDKSRRVEFRVLLEVKDPKNEN